MTAERSSENQSGNSTKADPADTRRADEFARISGGWSFELDHNLCFTHVCVRHQEITGLDPAELIGKPRWQVYDALKDAKTNDPWSAHRTALENQQDWQDFLFCGLSDRGTRIFSDSATALFDADGRFLGYRGFGRDVTEAVTATARLNALLDVVPDAVVTTDEKGMIRSFSTAAEALFGYREREVLGENVSLLMMPEEQQRHDTYMRNYRETGEQKIIGQKREVLGRKRDGSGFPIHLITRESTIHGERIFTGLIQDRSELRSVEDLRDRLATIIDRSLNEFYVFDARTLRFIQVNFGACNNLGYSVDELRKLTPIDIKPDMTAGAFEDLLRPLRRGERDVVVFKSRHQRKDGSAYPVKVHLQLMAEESPPLFLAVIQDITEAERREAQLRQAHKMEAIGQLTGGIAHDFNNLLTVIIGNNELLADLLRDSPEKLELLNEATSAAEYGAKLTGQLLAFARKQPLEPRVVDLNHLIEEMSDMLRRTLGETIEFQAILSPNLMPTRVDPVQTHNALLNMAINARDAMPSGGKLIIETSNVSLDRTAANERQNAEPGHYVRVSVRDTGVGMSADLQARALEPFFTTKEVGRGTGLGLAMVHGFAQQSGGFLEIYSEEGYGTAISFYLPAEVSAQTGDDEQETAAVTALPDAAVILVVEDDARVRSVTLKRLRHLGYRTEEAESGQQALDILEQRKDIDLVFTDMIMPGGMTGAELLDRVNGIDPTIRKLIASGYAEDGLLPNGGTRWLQKPYSIDQLSQALQDLLA